MHEHHHDIMPYVLVLLAIGWGLAFVTVSVREWFERWRREWW